MDEWRKKYEDALRKIEQLQRENEQLRLQLKNFHLEAGRPSEDQSQKSSPAWKPGPAVHQYSKPEEKIALFRSLFRGREDVYPIRWTGKQGKSGYSPACGNEWTDVCWKPAVKCSACAHQNFLPVTDEVIARHLDAREDRTIGVYPLLPDETCWFLAMDFDKTHWQQDAAAVMEVCKACGIPAALERSRSGSGGHIWIFFTEPVQAAIARKMGFILLSRAMRRRHQIGLDSFDRMFPNQDTMPKGGFGNLIALPL